MFVKLAFSLEQVSEIKMILFHLESDDVSIFFALWFFLYTKLSSTQQTTTYIHGMVKRTRWDLTEYKRRQLRVEKIEADYEWQPGKFLIIFLR